MRSPWNNNPSKFICRRNSTYGVTKQSFLPTCTEFKKCFQTESLKQMRFFFNGMTHGPVHILLGGGWNEDKNIVSYYYYY